MTVVDLRRGHSCVVVQTFSNGTMHFEVQSCSCARNHALKASASKTGLNFRRKNFGLGGVSYHRRRAINHGACQSGWQQGHGVLRQKGWGQSVQLLLQSESVGFSRLHFCECSLKNQYEFLPEGELVSIYIHDLYQLSRFNLKQHVHCCLLRQHVR